MPNFKPSFIIPHMRTALSSPHLPYTRAHTSPKFTFNRIMKIKTPDGRGFCAGDSQLLTRFAFSIRARPQWYIAEQTPV